MKMWDFKPNGDLFTTVAVGAAVATAPIVIPFAWSVVRPLLKTVIKGGFMLYETGHGAYAAVAEYASAEQAAVTPAKKPVQKKAGTTPTGREQSLGAKTAKGASIQKPKPSAKTPAKKSEKK